MHIQRREFGRKALICRGLALGGLLLAALSALPATPLHAEDSLNLGNLLADVPKDPAAEAKRDEIDRAYQAAKKKTPVAQQPSDPWGSVRNAPAAPAKKSAGAK